MPLKMQLVAVELRNTIPDSISLSDGDSYELKSDFAIHVYAGEFDFNVLHIESEFLFIIVIIIVVNNSFINHKAFFFSFCRDQ